VSGAQANGSKLSAIASAGTGLTGNGAPSGSHYTLNIIGVPKVKTADMTGNNGGRIFVLLNGGEDATSLNGNPYNTLNRSARSDLYRHPPAKASRCGMRTQPTARARSSSFRPTFRVPGMLDASARDARWLGDLRSIVHRHRNGADLLLQQQRAVLPYKRKSTFADVTNQLLFLTVTIDSVATPSLEAASCRRRLDPLSEGAAPRRTAE
jgi:hypothetical protein